MRDTDLINYFGGKGKKEYINALSSYMYEAIGINKATKLLDLFGGGGHLIMTFIDDFKTGIYNEYDRCLTDLFIIAKEQGKEQNELLDLIDSIEVDEEMFKKLRYIWDNLEQYTNPDECGKTYEDAGLTMAKRAFIPYALSCCSYKAKLLKFSLKDREKKYIQKKDSIENAFTLLRNVEIINGDYAVQMEKYKNDKDCVIILDPPYVHETRSKNNNYVKEWDTEDHIVLVDKCLEVTIPLILCGYETEQTKHLYGRLVANGWTRVALLEDTKNPAKTEYIWHNLDLLK